MNAWKATTFLFAGFLLLSMVWNGVLTLMVFGLDQAGPPVEKVEAAAANPAEAAPIRVDADDDPVLGRTDASVEIIVFSDFQCPFCGRFHDQTLQRIREEYIEPGLVKLVFRDFPLGNHARALPAAIAAECVQELGGDDAYFDYVSRLFGGADLEELSLQTEAEAMGIDGGDFAHCAADEGGRMAAEIRGDEAAGRTAGVRGTPTAFINGRALVGAQPFEAFKTAIELALEGR